MDVSKVSSAIQSGLSGYNRAEQGVAEAAADINRLNVEADNAPRPPIEPQTEFGENRAAPVSLETEAVNLIVNEHLAKANVKVIKTADDMLGSLIDTKV